MRGGRRSPAALLVPGGLALLLLAPMAWMILSAFKDRVVMLRLPPVLLFLPTLHHFSAAFVDRGLLGAVGVSLAVAVTSTAAAVLLGYPAGVILGTSRGPLPRHTLFLVLTARLVPPVALGLPLYGLFRDLHLLGTVQGLVLAHAAYNLSFVIWMVAAYSNQLPAAVFDAARLDGLSGWELVRLLWSPLRAGVAVVAVFCGVFSWGELYLGSILGGEGVRPLTVGVLGLVTSRGTYWGQVCAIASVGVLPAVLLAWLLGGSAARVLSFGAIEEVRE